ncbi:hypothetical protein DNTS_002562 [Danionella cerebrum]|uniref:Uncharacterized protein n=1 Tax=Danionella cerebrum TaxID=2873325 RepID=A0A553QSZ6_9TELE|nr:hypothetical protein DNTS_002562 [Danionella translucida]
MELAERCVLLLVCVAVSAALDLDALDPGYYLESSSPAEVIDYKDPCKAENALITEFLYRDPHPLLCRGTVTYERPALIINQGGCCETDSDNFLMRGL